MTLNKIIEKIINVYRHFSAKHASRKDYYLQSDVPIISFTFDDVYHSAVKYSTEILKRYNLRATYYLSLGLTGKQNEYGKLHTLDDIRQLSETGNELGCHTYCHSDAWHTPVKDYEESIKKNIAEFSTMVSNVKFKTFAYPKGSATPKTKKIARKYYSCSRGIYKGINAGHVDLNLLYGCPINEKIKSVENIQEMIDLNRMKNGWLIYILHDISEKPSKYGVTPGLFEAIVNASLKSGASIMTLEEACRSLGIF
jgi:peptidoglycan/xylan/chitin deacetylase (PgdA/CDA1 family)